MTFSFQFQNYLFSTKLSIAEFYEINGLLLLSWTQNIFFHTYFLQLSFEFQSIRMYYRLKMWNMGIDCGKFGFGIRLLPGPEIDSDGDCIVTACLSQVLSDIWAISVIKWKMCSFFVRASDFLPFFVFNYLVILFIRTPVVPIRNEFRLTRNQTKWPIELWTLKQEMETDDDDATIRESF